MCSTLAAFMVFEVLDNVQSFLHLIKERMKKVWLSMCNKFKRSTVFIRMCKSSLTSAFVEICKNIRGRKFISSTE